VRESLSEPPREGTGGLRPEGVLGVSPARRTQFDPPAPTNREDSAIGTALGSVKKQGKDAHFDAAIVAPRNG
jgi:hypothetical protein